MSIITLLAVMATLEVHLCLDPQKHLEYEHALDYIVEVVREGRVGSFEEGSLKRCVQSKCCVCGKQFKNTTYCSLHIALHHQQSFEHPQEIAVLFDDNVPTQQKYHFCLQYLEGHSLTPSQREEVCVIVSQGYYKPNVLIDVVRYILYVGLAIVLLIYYSDVSSKTE